MKQCSSCHTKLDKHTIKYVCGGCLKRKYCSEQCATFDWAVGKHHEHCAQQSLDGNHIGSHDSFLFLFANSLLSYALDPSNEKTLASLSSAPSSLESLLKFASSDFLTARLESGFDIKSIIEEVSTGFISKIKTGNTTMFVDGVRALASYFRPLIESKETDSIEKVKQFNTLFARLTTLLLLTPQTRDTLVEISGLANEIGEYIDYLLDHVVEVAHIKQSNPNVSFENSFKNHAFAAHLLATNPHRPEIPIRMLKESENDIEHRSSFVGTALSDTTANRRALLAARKKGSNKHLVYGAAADHGKALDAKYPASVGPLFDLQREKQLVSFIDPETKERVEEPVLFESKTWVATNNNLFFYSHDPITRDPKVVIYKISDLSQFHTPPQAISDQLIEAFFSRKGMARAKATLTGKGKKLTESKAAKRNDLTLSFGATTDLRYFPNEKGIFVVIDQKSLARDISMYHPIMLHGNPEVLAKFNTDKNKSNKYRMIMHNDKRLRTDSQKTPPFTDEDFELRRLVLVERTRPQFVRDPPVGKNKPKNRSNPFSRESKFFTVYEDIRTMPLSTSASTSSSPSPIARDVLPENENLVEEFAALKQATTNSSSTPLEKKNARAALVQWESEHPEFIDTTE